MTTKELNNAVEAYKTISNFTASELETLEILANHKDEIVASIEEAKTGNTFPISSIL